MTRASKNHEVLVPIAELWQAQSYVSAAVSLIPGRPDEQASYVEKAYGVAVQYDYADRPAVSLSDAYMVRDKRKQAQAELTAAHNAELLDAARLEDWRQARVRFWSHNLPEAGRRFPNAHEGMGKVNQARQACADACMAAERAAGIPEDVQKRLGWPPHGAALAYDDTREPYQPPTS